VSTSNKLIVCGFTAADEETTPTINTPTTAQTESRPHLLRMFLFLSAFEPRAAPRSRWTE
jgi:hypothetical protein